jgi:ketosteroid isomerase-like protein
VSLAGVPGPYTVDALLAREEITDVVKRLARATDRLDAALIVSCYHDDGFDDHNAFRGTASEFARWVVDVLPHFEATMHFVGPPLIRLEGDVAHVDTYCVAHHVSKPDAEGNATDMVLGLRYVDRFERRDERWLIANRVCAFDWTATVPVDGSTRYRFEDDWTVGARDRTDVAYRGV